MNIGGWGTNNCMQPDRSYRWVMGDDLISIRGCDLIGVVALLRNSDSINQASISGKSL
jgi:hypothetical protein